MKLLSLLPILSQALVGNFLHITDIHYDPNYKVGSPVHCLLGKIGLGCCRAYNIPVEPYERANKWGNYHCDTSYNFVNRTLEWIRINIPKIDFIIYTGDTVGHHDITQSINHNIKVINDINGLFEYYFNDVEIYSSIGNHDTYPIDQTQKTITKVFLKNFAKTWSGVNSTQTISSGGYYWSKIGENMYIVNLNSLLYDKINIFHLDERIQQWVWFKNVLETIKNSGGRAWIVNHICPFSSEARATYTKQFLSIVSDYTDIIKYHFYGHVHQDTFTLLSMNNEVVAFCSIPSSLMLDKHEASFRIYKYDKTTFDILDYDHYVSNLETTVQNDNINFYKSYSFNSEYNLKGVNQDNLIQLYNNMKINDTVFERFYKNYNPGLNDTNCSSSCKTDLLDDIFKNLNF